MAGHEHEHHAGIDPLLPAHPGPQLEPSAEEAAIHDDARLFTSADYLSLDPAVEAALSRRINLYYNTPLDIFPYGELNRKPDRFHVLYVRQIEERFPDDAGMRDDIAAYGRVMFRWLASYMIGKRAIQLGALAALWGLVAFGPMVLKDAGVAGVLGVAGSAALMVLVAALFAAVNAMVFTQYRLGLENRSYSLSREIVQYTRTLQNDYTTIRALPDQSETHFHSDGGAWGRRSEFLIRLLMWIGARMEYLEKFVQAAMWRVRRERYWMDWAGGVLAVVVLIAWAAALALISPPAGGAAGLRTLQATAAVIGLAISWGSFFRWRTPVNLVRDKLDPDSWIRYATLDLDDSIGEQIRRDKERLVEYRNLMRGH